MTTALAPALDTVIHGDALAVLKTLPGNSVDSIVCDPPAGIAFMAKDWDKDKGGRDAWVAWLSEIMTEALRCLKPGGHALVWSLPRTSHWTAYALENAGFEIRDSIHHIFGSGMPKSHDISKAIDRMKGAEREVVGRSNRHAGGSSNKFAQDEWTRNNAATMGMTVTAPATSEAQQWNGWGTGLKPSHEVWWLARKPLAASSIAAQVLATGTGAINIDASRITLTGIENHKTAGSGQMGGHGIYGTANEVLNSKQVARAEQGLNPRYEPLGRWPSNTLFSHAPGCVPTGMKRVKANGASPLPRVRDTDSQHLVGLAHDCTISYADPDGTELVESWHCAPDCPIAELDRQSGIRGNTYRPSGSRAGKVIHGQATSFNEGQIRQGDVLGYDDQGGASRYYQCFPPFLYQSKPSRRERNAGCEGLPQQAVAHRGHGNNEHDDVTSRFVTQPQGNRHPTVKSLALCRYLIRMITPPGGVVLDMFAGSGSTCVAAVQEGAYFIGIEKEQEYIDIAQARIAHVQEGLW